MRDYAKISPKFWIGATGKKLRSAGAEAQVVAMYLMSSPHANMLGLYYCPEMFIAHETGLGLEGASKGLLRCIEAGFCEYDESAEVVWVIEMARFQIDDALNPGDKRCSGVQNTYNDLPQNRFLAGFFEKYAAAFNLKTKRENTSPLEAPSKPLRSQEQEQEQEQVNPTSLRDVSPSGSVKQKSITLSQWIAEAKAKGETAISDYKPVWDHCKQVGIPADWVEIAWITFRDRYTSEEKARRKRYIDWRGVFLRSVKENWLHLWFWSEKDEQFHLTTVGVSADITTREAA